MTDSKYSYKTFEIFDKLCKEAEKQKEDEDKCN